jgi:peptidyl-dipeptidase A
MRTVGTPLLVLLTAACVRSGAGEIAGPTTGATPGEAAQFARDADAHLRELWAEADRIAWINSTYITEDTDWLASRSTERVMATIRGLIDHSDRYADLDLDPDVARQLRLLRLSLSAPAPSDPAERRQLAEVRTYLKSAYGVGKYCPPGGECLDLNALSKIMATSHDYDRLLAIWKGWHAVSPPMRDEYEQFVTLTNKGAEEIGFRDNGQLWRSRYDMPPEAFEAEVERLWRKVAPLYQSLHCYVRMKLRAKYGENHVPKHGLIPAHLLGNMWAQEWGNIYDLVEPYPGKASLDVTKRMVNGGWDAQKMVQTGERFFVSLGLPSLPKTFWIRSMLTKPADREVVCHASAWDIGASGDVRIKMCAEVTEEDLYTVHHELGHDYYYLMYNDKPLVYQQGAHDGFHEAIGDALVLSATPGYLEKIGLLDSVPSDPESSTNVLMKRALDKVAFLPFGKMMDQWRWEVFDGRISPEEYNAGWWRLREQYQGIAPPAPRSENDFDPGAKYHIPANTPYARYFLATILQFQFHRALCAAAGHKGPLHECSIYDSKPAGEKLAAMLSMGASRPWPDALEAMTGQRSMDGSALLEYFEPLAAYLESQTKDETCGW